MRNGWTTTTGQSRENSLTEITLHFYILTCHCFTLNLETAVFLWYYQHNMRLHRGSWLKRYCYWLYSGSYCFEFRHWHRLILSFSWLSSVRRRKWRHSHLLYVACHFDFSCCYLALFSHNYWLASLNKLQRRPRHLIRRPRRLRSRRDRFVGRQSIPCKRTLKLTRITRVVEKLPPCHGVGLVNSVRSKVVSRLYRRVHCHMYMSVESFQ
jgi:hypothetical protein